MKRQVAISVLVIVVASTGASLAAAQLGNALKGLGKKATAAAAAPKPAEPSPAPAPAPTAAAPAPAAAPPATAAATAPTSSEPDYKAYQNYDFVPGDKIVFDDDFRSDDDGEFPAHWKLSKGQGVVNKLDGVPLFALTEGNYVMVSPRVTVPTYLSDPFTIEFDYYPKAGGYGKVIAFLHAGDTRVDISFGAEVSTGGFPEQSANQSARYPAADGFTNKWHHAALVFKGGQLKCYEDQYRVLVIPDVGTYKPESVSFGGIGDPGSPLMFSNVRIANGGGMTMIDKLTKDGRIVTHGILFDVNKSIVKPESMGTVRQLVAMLQADTSLKLEVGGYTDADGDAAKNLTLSDARANAVKQVLIEQGIDASRLTAKGYGATKPIDSNATPEGKANNRRVEFVKP